MRWAARHQSVHCVPCSCLRAGLDSGRSGGRSGARSGRATPGRLTSLYSLLARVLVMRSLRGGGGGLRVWALPEGGVGRRRARARCGDTALHAARFARRCPLPGATRAAHTRSSFAAAFFFRASFGIAAARFASSGVAARGSLLALPWALSGLCTAPGGSLHRRTTAGIGGSRVRARQGASGAHTPGATWHDRSFAAPAPSALRPAPQPAATPARRLQHAVGRLLGAWARRAEGRGGSRQVNTERCRSQLKQLQELTEDQTQPPR